MPAGCGERRKIKAFTTLIRIGVFPFLWLRLLFLTLPGARGSDVTASLRKVFQAYRAPQIKAPDKSLGLVGTCEQVNHDSSQEKQSSDRRVGPKFHSAGIVSLKY